MDASDLMAVMDQLWPEINRLAGGTPTCAQTGTPFEMHDVPSLGEMEAHQVNSTAWKQTAYYHLHKASTLFFFLFILLSPLSSSPPHQM